MRAKEGDAHAALTKFQNPFARLSGLLRGKEFGPAVNAG